jgi:signal-transduction protein with cAMP-binding, CBS, and nucleotidyltransferase domain
MGESESVNWYQARVGDHLQASPLCIAVDSNCLTAIQMLRRERTACALVLDPGGGLAGVLSAGDLLQRLPFGAEAVTPIHRVMSQPPPVRVETPLFEALVLLRRYDLAYLPVVDRGGCPVGMITAGRLLETLLPQPFGPLEAHVLAGTPADLRQARARQAELVTALLDQGLPAVDIQAILSALNDDVYRRVLEQSLAELAEQGWGAPPVAFAAVVTGSLGRRESLLRPDQDNGFILADYPDAEHVRINEFFYELAVRMTRRLDAVDIPLCHGQVMASNPSWRKRLEEWQQQFLGWLQKPSPAAVMLFDIWIDFRPVYGADDLAETLRRFVTAAAPQHPNFLRELDVSQFEREVAITPFRTLKRERLPGQADHRHVDVKRKGLRPLVEGVRLLALRQGTAATATAQRLAQLRDAGVFNADLGEALEDALHGLSELLLRAQLRRLEQGGAPGACVDPEALSRRERVRLKESLRAVLRLRGMVHTEFSAELF